MKNELNEMEILKEREMLNLANSELLTLGEGQVGYAKPLAKSELAEMEVEVDFQQAWGIFSATGETLALCDGPSSVWAFFADNELDAVSLH